MQLPQVSAVIAPFCWFVLFGWAQIFPAESSASTVNDGFKGEISAGSDALDHADYARAIVKFKRAMELIPQSKGPGLSERALAAEGLGVAYCRMGRYSQAEVDFRYALAVWRDLSETETSRVAIALTNLGTACFYTGRLREARKLHYEALRIDEKLFGPHSIVVANDLNNLATIEIKERRFSQAERLLRRAIRNNSSAPGHDSRGSIFMRNLAVVFMHLRRYQDAAGLQKEVLEVQRAELGRTHPAVGTTLSQLALSEVGVKQCGAAAGHAQEGLDILRAALGDAHPFTAEAYRASGEAYDCVKRFDLAERALARAIDIEARQEQPPEDASIVLRAYARILRKIHRSSEAVRYDTLAAAVDAANGQAERSRHVVDVKQLQLR